MSDSKQRPSLEDMILTTSTSSEVSYANSSVTAPMSDFSSKQITAEEGRRRRGKRRSTVRFSMDDDDGSESESDNDMMDDISERAEQDSLDAHEDCRSERRFQWDLKKKISHVMICQVLLSIIAVVCYWCARCIRLLTRRRRRIRKLQGEEGGNYMEGLDENENLTHEDRGLEGSPSNPSSSNRSFQRGSQQGQVYESQSSSIGGGGGFGGGRKYGAATGKIVGQQGTFVPQIATQAAQSAATSAAESVTTATAGTGAAKGSVLATMIGSVASSDRTTHVGLAIGLAATLTAAAATSTILLIDHGNNNATISPPTKTLVNMNATSTSPINTVINNMNATTTSPIDTVINNNINATTTPPIDRMINDAADTEVHGTASQLHSLMDEISLGGFTMALPTKEASPTKTPSFNPSQSPSVSSTDFPSILTTPPPLSNNQQSYLPTHFPTMDMPVSLIDHTSATPTMIGSLGIPTTLPTSPSRPGSSTPYSASQPPIQSTISDPTTLPAFGSSDKPSALSPTVTPSPLPKLPTTPSSSDDPLKSLTGTPIPTQEITREGTLEATQDDLTQKPSKEPSVVPFDYSYKNDSQPSMFPTAAPTILSSIFHNPSPAPIPPEDVPTGLPPASPISPTSGPPTLEPTLIPTLEPSGRPSDIMTASSPSTSSPSRATTGLPIDINVDFVSSTDIVSEERNLPTTLPSDSPSLPTAMDPHPLFPTKAGPAKDLTKQTTKTPTAALGNPTPLPTRDPTFSPTFRPTRNPTNIPTPFPTSDPTNAPTPFPTRNPTPHLNHHQEVQAAPTTTPPTSLPAACLLSTTSFTSKYIVSFHGGASRHSNERLNVAFKYAYDGFVLRNCKAEIEHVRSQTIARGEGRNLQEVLEVGFTIAARQSNGSPLLDLPSDEADFLLGLNEDLSFGKSAPGCPSPLPVLSHPTRLLPQPDGQQHHQAKPQHWHKAKHHPI